MLKINVITMVNSKRVLYITQMLQNNRSPAVLQIGVTGEASPGLSGPREGRGGTLDHPEITIKPF